jgi:hypothetical protein
MMYRLHIDIPMAMGESDAAALSQEIVAALVREMEARLVSAGIDGVNYRLGHDEDRQKSNYLVKTPMGHVVNKKSRIEFTRKETDV